MMYYPDFTRPGVDISATRQCAFCGQWHVGMCSRVKRVEYNFNGSIRCMEFFKDNEIKKEISDELYPTNIN